MHRSGSEPRSARMAAFANGIFGKQPLFLVEAAVFAGDR